MHIITGMLLSLLFTKKKDASLPPLLQMRWPIQTRHLLPGRVRFMIPLFKGNQRGLDEAVVQIKKIEGIVSAKANAISGSFLIHFDQSKLQADLLLAALIRLLDLEKEIERTPSSRVNKEISDIYNAMNQAVYSKTNGSLDLTTLIAITLGATGIYRIFTNRTVSMPAALTMVWWAYNSLTKNSNSGSS